MVRKAILSAALLLAGLFYAPAFAEDDKVHAPIPMEKRIKNENNKRCVWDSVEMLANRAKEERLYGLSKKYDGPTQMPALEAVLQKEKVEYKINPMGNKTMKAVYEFLVIPCEYEKRGVAVCFRPDAVTRHMLNVVHYDLKNKKVSVIDNCDPKLEVKQMDWDRFHQLWDGTVVIIYAKNDPFPRYRAIWD